MTPEYQYKWIPGKLAPPALLEELAHLYSNHYGEWGINGRHPFQSVKLSPSRIRDWLGQKDTMLAYATAADKVVGYAIAVRPKVPDLGLISWVTQLVVHRDHRQRDVGKNLLFSAWNFSDHYAWGLVTANPYAVRALEKATRRRCDPIRIAQNDRRLVKLGAEYTAYVKEDTDCLVKQDTSRINTKFFIDHSDLRNMLNAVVKPDVPWTLGDLPEGWEWMAFTFNDQPEISLSDDEIKNMLDISDEVAKDAYSRMRIKASHKWAQHTDSEVTIIANECQLSEGSSVLDIGCGSGRHVTELSSRGFVATGVDYLEASISDLRRKTVNQSNATFAIGDARHLNLGHDFDAVICLYDVIGSYVNNEDNLNIVKSIRRHLKPGARAMISVMNFEVTFRQCSNFFSLSKSPDKLLKLKASTDMQDSGNVFNPDHYMIDESTDIVYRKEQFSSDDKLPAELLVRDRRYRLRDIEATCMKAGLRVLWSRYVQSGRWEIELAPEDPKAKEILLLCEALTY